MGLAERRVDLDMKTELKAMYFQEIQLSNAESGMV